MVRNKKILARVRGRRLGGLFFCVCASDLPDFPIIPSRQRAVRRSEARSVVGSINHTHRKRGALIRAVAGRHGDFPRSTVRGVRPLPQIQSQRGRVKGLALRG